MDKIKMKINKILGYKTIDDHTYNRVIKLTEHYKDTDPVFYNITIARILINSCKFAEAKEYLLDLIEIEPNHPSIYYNLYKVEVHENNFVDAFLDLYKYKQLQDHTNINISLPISMLEMYLDMCFNFEYYLQTDYSIKDSNFFGRTPITNHDLRKLYSELISAFNDKDFKKMKKILSEMEILINSINYRIEVNTIKQILRAIIIKEKELSKAKTKTKTH